MIEGTNDYEKDWFIFFFDDLDCSALELAISEHTLWLLTSHGRIQCRENISITDPTGTRLTTLPGRFNSIAGLSDEKRFSFIYLVIWF